MAFEKKYLKTKPVCKVKFIAPKELTEGASSLAIAGDFNDWDTQAHILKKQKDGSFATTLDLPKNSEFQYRYVINGERWENDFTADKYVPNNIGSEENSVIVIEE